MSDFEFRNGDNNEEYIKCPNCDDVITFETSLKRRIHRKHIGKKLDCNYCENAATTSDSSLDHVAINHLKRNSKQKIKIKLVTRSPISRL